MTQNNNQTKYILNYNDPRTNYHNRVTAEFDTWDKRTARMDELEKAWDLEGLCMAGWTQIGNDTTTIHNSFTHLEQKDKKDNKPFQTSRELLTPEQINSRETLTALKGEVAEEFITSDREVYKTARRSLLIQKQKYEKQIQEISRDIDQLEEAANALDQAFLNGTLHSAEDAKGVVRSVAPK